MIEVGERAPVLPVRSAVSVVIPTYGRDSVLVETVESLLPQIGNGELVIVDQTPRHEEAVALQLEEWNASGRIRWLRRTQPSITQAMNAGLLAASCPLVLFLDDDIRPDPKLIAAHAGAHAEFPEAWGVVGQVLQPGERPTPRGAAVQTDDGLLADLNFPFCSDSPAWVKNVMAGNLSVKRERAIAAGGFDENFVGSAYRFETEFARRLIRAGGRIRFEPGASIDHLRAERGGTRSTGSHLTSASPSHGLGDYYFALRSGVTPTTVAYMLARPVREVCTRFHLRHPWYIPVKLLGESRAMVAGIRAWMRPAKLISEKSS